MGFDVLNVDNRAHEDSEGKYVGVVLLAGASIFAGASFRRKKK